MEVRANEYDWLVHSTQDVPGRHTGFHPCRSFDIQIMKNRNLKMRRPSTLKNKRYLAGAKLPVLVDFFCRDPSAGGLLLCR